MLRKSPAERSADQFTFSVIQEAIAAAADEMFAVLRKTAMSPIIYEVLDFGAGVADSTGNLLSSGAGIPGFVGAIDKAVKRLIELVPLGNVTAGDIFVTNDPYAGGVTHLNDVVLLMPVFAGGQLLSRFDWSGQRSSFVIPSYAVIRGWSMAGKSPVLATQEQIAALESKAVGSDRAEADRARAILLTLRGWTNPHLAEAFGVREDTVRLWRSQFMNGGVEALETRPLPVECEGEDRPSRWRTLRRRRLRIAELREHPGGRPMASAACSSITPSISLGP
jgi:Hydantoinase B/oxoprolinase/Helix-turn-helix domain